jgi:predicted small lipoprotein YifL
MEYRPRRSAFVASFLALAAASVAACGSRGPLDVDVVYVVADAASDGTSPTPTLDAGHDTASADATPDVHADAPSDAPHEAGLINCGSCVAQTCGQSIVQCLTDAKCRATLTCVTQKCLGGGGGGGGGGGFDPSCLFTCANGDASSLATLVKVFTCVTQKCGPDCGNVLGGLGGLGGGGGGGGGGRGGGNSPAPGNGSPAPNGREIFSHYPELMTPVEAAPEQ